MASADQLEAWKAMGGKVEGAAKKGAKKDASIFISPSGKQGRENNRCVTTADYDITSTVSVQARN